MEFSYVFISHYSIINRSLREYKQIDLSDIFRNDRIFLEQSVII